MDGLFETPRWGVSRARGTGCSNCSLLYQEQHLMGCCSFVLHGFMEQKKSTLETPRWGVSRARGTGCSNCSFIAQEQHLMGCCSFVLHGFMECCSFVSVDWPETPRWGVSRARGTAVRTALLLQSKSSTLWGAALFVLHGFYGAKSGLTNETPGGAFRARTGRSNCLLL